jgi:hypothetical protein
MEVFSGIAGWSLANRNVGQAAWKSDYKLFQASVRTPLSGGFAFLLG